MNRVIVVFGGAFNPPTNSHFSLAEQICSEYEEVEQVIFIPVSDAYPKDDLLYASYRVEMLQKVCDKNPKFTVSTIEADKQKVSSTLDTLEKIKNNYSACEIWFTMGTDNLKSITSWYGYKELISQYKLLVLERDHDVMNQIINQNKELKQYEKNFIKVKETVRSDCNSTLIREKLRRGKSIRYLVPDEVYEYVKIKGLYTIIETDQ